MINGNFILNGYTCPHCRCYVYGGTTSHQCWKAPASGYGCMICGRWVMPGVSHSCKWAVPNTGTATVTSWPPVPPKPRTIEDRLEAIQEAVDVISDIVRRLEEKYLLEAD